MQNTIRIEDINFRTSFHSAKRHGPDQAQKRRPKYKHSLNLSAEEQSLILMPNQRQSLPKFSNQIRQTKLGILIEDKQEIQMMPKPIFSQKISKNSFTTNQNTIKLNKGVIERGSSSTRQEPAHIKFKQKNYQEIITQIIKHQQEETPKNQRLPMTQVLPQKIITHKLKFDKTREYLKINKNIILARKDQTIKKRNSCSLPSINNFNVVLENKVGEITWVKSMVFEEKPLQIQINVPYIKRNLQQKYNAIHERQFKKLTIEKALKKRKELIKHQRAQTQLHSQPLEMTLISDKKKLAKKYEESLKAHYDQLIQICRKSEPSSFE